MGTSLHHLAHSYHKNLPWGVDYLTRKNLLAGYMAEEGRLVARYLQPRSRILIIGAGNGREALPIIDEGHTIVCIDYAHTYLLAGDKILRTARKPTVYFVNADMHNLPLHDNIFSFIFFSLYSCAGARRLSILKDIARVAQTGAHVLLTACTPSYRQSTRAPAACSKWHFFNTIDELRNEAEAGGFELLEAATEPLRPVYLLAILKKNRNP
jgi:ubiquinone/menaquinone biosynthesis C-methylase UbiE